ncbi:MAG: amidohydrolase family protein [Rubripirellula sp.]|nr:amidohydrolase family protein [Rubripirellula sp.]
MRPQLIAGIFVAMIAGDLSQAMAQQNSSQPKVKHLIDTHIHLYDTTREVYEPDHSNSVPWPPADDQVLHKPHLPAEYHKVAKPAGVTGVVIVEASPRVDDNDWVLDLVDDDDFFVGLVGNLDPLKPSFRKNLDRLKADPRFVGIRFHLMNREAGISSDPQLLKNLRYLADAGLALDVLMNEEGPGTIDEVSRIASQVPNLRIIVNHVLGYNIDGKLPNKTWITAVNQLAKNPNVSVKISGLYQRSTTQPAPQSIEYFQGLLDILWNAFGRERLIYGSNWPVTKKTGDYASFVKLVSTYFADKDQAAAESFFWKNASTAYRLKLK